MFHIEYNNERGFFDWSELRCLCRALGFQPDLISLNLPSEVDQDEPGMVIKDLVRIINLKYLDMAVDKTFNAHTADWNLCVFKKAIVLIDHRVLTYQQVHDIRVSFCAYEHQDLKGMEINENTIMRCLKMCGRIIAPLKMHHRIKHMSQMFDEEGRIQFYEFLDLILWTELYHTHRPHEPVVTNAKRQNSSTYQVEDFEHIIQHYDERLAQYLNELYLDEEWTFGKEEFSKQKLPNELPVNRDFRLHNMSKSKKHYHNLKNHVTKSQDTVHITSTGHIRPRPLTAPNLEKYEQSEKSSIYTAHSQHKLSVADMVRDYIQTPASRLTRSAMPKTKHSLGDPATLAPSSPQFILSVKPAVTSDDKVQRQHDLQDLKFYMSTIENRYDQKLHREIKEQLPKYVPQPKKTEEQPAESEVKPLAVKIKAPNPALLPDHIDRLAYPPYRPVPKRSHAQKCDARFRGWHKVKTSRGQHYILTKTSFGDNPNSKEIAKIYDQNCKEIKNVKGDCVVRKTTDELVRPEITRPATVPAVMNKVTLNPVPQRGQHYTGELRQSSAPAPPLRSSAHTASGRQPRRASAGHSAAAHSAASSGRTYSFGDFKIYAEEWEKPNENKELRASNLMLSTEVAAPTIVVHKASRAGLPAEGDADIVESEDDDDQVDMNNQSKRTAASKVARVKQFVRRRMLSGYAKKRLIDSAVSNSSRASLVSAC